MKKNSPYLDKLRDPRWQQKRLKIFERDKFTCQECGNTDKPLAVHHLSYNGEPWETPDEMLLTVCEVCHSNMEETLKTIRTLIPKHFGALREVCDFLRIDKSDSLESILIWCGEPLFVQSLRAQIEALRNVYDRGHAEGTRLSKDAPNEN